MTLSPRKPLTSPFSIKRGVVKIYHTPQRIGGTEYEAFTISYLSEGKRRRKKFSDLDEAQSDRREDLRRRT